jgi:nicotinamide-nucleotide amidase
MEDLHVSAAALAACLKGKRQRIAVAESSTGGLIAAALLAEPGASAYFLGGGVIYTTQSREALLGISAQDMAGMRSASEPYALLLAKRVREKLGADWGLAETGASGPTGNRYGDAAGHSCIAVVGHGIERVITLETGSADRRANMRRFAQGAFGLAIKTIA